MKKMNKKGFTLAELLIVVAIIAVLVAVAIPVFSAQLDKARDATNLSNARAIYAMLVADYLDDGEVNTYSAANASWNGASDATITMGDQNFKFTKLKGATATLTYTSASGTVGPKIAYSGLTSETFGG